jgi:hypothetical protein
VQKLDNTGAAKRLPVFAAPCTQGFDEENRYLELQNEADQGLKRAESSRQEPDRFGVTSATAEARSASGRPARADSSFQYLLGQAALSEPDTPNTF